MKKCEMYSLMALCTQTVPQIMVLLVLLVSLLKSILYSPKFHYITFITLLGRFFDHFAAVA